MNDGVVLVDVGNTSTTLALSCRGRLRCTSRKESHLWREELAIRRALRAMSCQHRLVGGVIASVVPVHGIVSAVMGEVGQPELLLSGSMSEHRATFTPQQIA